MQAVNYAHCIENLSKVVNVFNVYNKNTFNDCLIENYIYKSFSTVIIELNKQLFNSYSKRQDIKIYSNNFNLRNFLIYNEKLYQKNALEIQKKLNLKYIDTENIFY